MDVPNFVNGLGQGEGRPTDALKVARFRPPTRRQRFGPEHPSSDDSPETKTAQDFPEIAFLEDRSLGPGRGHPPLLPSFLAQRTAEVKEASGGVKGDGAAVEEVLLGFFAGGEHDPRDANLFSHGQVFDVSIV